MTQFQAIQNMALAFRRSAQATEMPAYATMMQRAAEDLERRLAELAASAQPASRPRTT